MGALVAKLKDLFGGNKKLEMCLVGLENSGKTTLLNVLSVGHPIETFPTVGLNVKMVKKQGVQLKVWDLGGQERFRAEWGRYTQGCDCIIFCLDIGDLDCAFSIIFQNAENNMEIHEKSLQISLLNIHVK